MRRNAIAAAFLICLTVPASIEAQEVVPRAGSWGAEASVDNDVSLLRFRSSTSAWLVGFSGFYLKRDEEDDTFETELTAISLRLGMRFYRAPTSRLRPFTTVAALVRYLDGIGSPPWAFGAQFEYGGAYFFTPRVSLGASFDVRGLYGSGTSDQGIGPEVEVTEFTLSSGLRFLGAVYF